jgi:hypothetical protein
VNALTSFAHAFGASTQHGNSRRAALVLHALQEPDRAWLLASLQPAQRSLLEGLVEELQHLGIPTDPSLVDEAIGVTASRSRAVARPASPEAKLEHADVRRLACILATEPAELTARLLGIRPWPWSAELLAQLGDAKRTSIRESLARMSDGRTAEDTPNSLELGLMRRLRDQLDREPRVASPGAGAAVRQAGLRSRAASAWSRLLRGAAR